MTKDKHYIVDDNNSEENVSYYIPNRKELNIGFTYQGFIYGVDATKGKRWHNLKIESFDDFKEVEQLFEKDAIRVRNIDVKDIEKLGFKHETIDSNGNEIDTGLYDYYFRKEDRKDFGTDRRVIELCFRPASSNYLSIVMIRINGDESRSIISFYRNELLFRGRITNFDELEKELYRVL